MTRCVLERKVKGGRRDSTPAQNDLTSAAACLRAAISRRFRVVVTWRGGAAERINHVSLFKAGVQVVLELAVGSYPMRQCSSYKSP